MTKFVPNAFFETLRAAGLADSNTVRVVIDINASDIPKVYIERVADSSVIRVIQTLAGIEIKREQVPEESE